MATHKKKKKVSRIKKKVIGVVSSVLSAPSRVKHKIRGLISDTRRGHLLHRQGFGKRRASALSIAKAGKKEGRQRRAKPKSKKKKK